MGHSKPQNLKWAIGKTPLIELKYTFKGESKTIYAKYESINLTGSIKDRMAYHIVCESYKRGDLKEGDEIVEATSGNTGISFSAIGAALGHPVTIFMPSWMSKERQMLIRSFGAKIRLVSKEENGFLGSIDLAEEYAKTKDNIFLPHQFSNEFNCQAHYLTTGPEIASQLKSINRNINAFVAGVGTGGTVMGTGKYLKQRFPEVKIHPLEPSNSPTLSTGYKVGSHRIQGISDEFIPEIVKLDELNDVIKVDDGDAIIMSQKLSKLGLGVGISSGANFLGAVKVLKELNDDATVVTVFSDSNKKYLSTDLLNNEPIKDGFISTDVQLKSFKMIPNVIK